ncbi:MAG: aminopeptidase P family protein [Phycisphaerales bacterium]|nr:aminopeptidase P family protein [Phycisphaerales bacterium]
MATPFILAGYPDRFPGVYHRIRFLCGDMTVFLDLGGGNTHLIVRNIELPRARQAGRARHIWCPEDLAPAGGLASDRDTSFAQAAAELLSREGVAEIRGDYLLPLLFVDVLGRRGVKVQFDPDLGRVDRRMKDNWEVQQLREAQQHTEAAIRHAYETIARADVVDGVLQHDGAALTADRLRSMIIIFLLQRGLSNPNDCIVAPGKVGADCHHRGEGVLRLNEPIIIDVFPMSGKSRYWGDCTRTICRGAPHPTLSMMHGHVVEAKLRAIEACRAGRSGAVVHQAVLDVFTREKYHIGMPPDDAPDDLIFYPHGTGHGIGLECHEPPILDLLCGELVDGDALTIEPGLYCKAIGGVRVEDMVIARPDGCENLNSLPEGLWWG